MRVFAGNECQPGESYLVFDESEFIMLMDRTPMGDPLADARAAVADFRSICSADARGSLQTDTSERAGWFRKRAVARGITCCMQLCSRLDSMTGDVTVSITTLPDCNGSGETMPHPERDMTVGCAGLLARKLCSE